MTTLSRTKQFMLICITSYLFFEYHLSSTQTLSQIKSQDFSAPYKNTITTSPLTYAANSIQDFVKCCIKRSVHLHLRPDNMLFGGLQPIHIHMHILRTDVSSLVYKMFN